LLNRPENLTHLYDSFKSFDIEVKQGIKASHYPRYFVFSMRVVHDLLFCKHYSSYSEAYSALWVAIDNLNLAPATSYRHKSYITEFFNWMYEKKISDFKPKRVRGRVKPQKRNRNAFEINEINRILEHINTLEGRQWEELHVYVQLLLYTGMRPGIESVNLRWSDIDLHNMVFRVRDGKTGSRYVIGMLALKPILLEWKEKTRDELFKLKNYIGLFNSVLHHLGLKDNRSLYSLRHTYCTEQLRSQKCDVYTLAKNIGSSVRMIERHYDHVLLGNHDALNNSFTLQT